MSNQIWLNGMLHTFSMHTHICNPYGGEIPALRLGLTVSTSWTRRRASRFRVQLGFSSSAYEESYDKLDADTIHCT